MTHLSKYLDIQKKFYDLSVETEINCKQVERGTKNLIGRARNDEQLAEYLMSVTALSSSTSDLIAKLKHFIEEVVNDHKATEGARVRDLLRDQLDTINILIAQRDKFIQDEAARIKGTIK